jgi:hypothetical protein
MTELAESVIEWSILPPADKKDLLMSDTELVKSMIANPKYPALPAACAKLDTMRKLTKPFFKDCLADFDPLVKLEVYQYAGESRAQGLECITHSFACFLIQIKLPTVASVVERVAIIKSFDATAVANRVTLSVSVVKALEPFKTAPAVAVV